MKYSQFDFLISNLFIISTLFIKEDSTFFTAMIMATLWLIAGIISLRAEYEEVGK